MTPDDANTVAVADESHWPRVWAWLSPKLAGRRVLALEGDLGAGKTTLVKAIAADLGYRGAVTSPTFSIVQEYPTPAGPVYHFDLYRLGDVDEVLDLDFEGYLAAARLAVVEWPGVARALLPPAEALWVRIEHAAHGGGRQCVVL